MIGLRLTFVGKEDVASRDFSRDDARKLAEAINQALWYNVAPHPARLPEGVEITVVRDTAPSQVREVSIDPDITSMNTEPAADPSATSNATF